MEQSTSNQFHPDSFRKEQVIRRLKDKAIQYWGLKESDGDSLDPIMEMLLGACAQEFERTSQEINNSQSRLLEHLAQVMVPEVYSNSRPAHAVMHARADGSFTILKPEDQFFIEKEILDNNKVSIAPITFSPVTTTKIFDASIVCQASGNKLTYYESPLTKGKSWYGSGKEMLSTNTLWLGIRVNKKNLNLTGMAFYFDWKAEGDNAKYLPLLSMSEWSMGDISLGMETGLNKNKEKAFISFDAMSELEGNILQYYHRQYLTIVKDGQDVIQKKYPEEFKTIFSTEQLLELKEDLVWIKIEFSGLSSQHPLNDLYCSINCLPVMNRKLNHNSRPYTLTPNLNIIPIQCSDHFLSVKRVYSDNRSFRTLSFKDMDNAEDGSYSIRQGGVSRFDRSNSTMVLRYLHNLLRDESAAFEAFGHHALTSEIKTLEQGLTRLQLHFIQKLNEQTSKYHLLLHTKVSEDVWIEYWSTQGTTANNLSIGKKVIPQTSVNVKRESLIFLTGSTGGKEPMNESEKLHAYKHTLLTRNRIVTEEDIKSACFADLGDKLERVEVKKGYVKNTSSKKGFVNTIDVVLYPAKDFRQINWRNTCQEVQANLERKKMFLTGINVLIENQEYVSS